jgi:rubrerythrin
MELKGSKTERNLQNAFATESQACNRYTYFSSQAKKDGYVQIAKIFEETAQNEKEHAKIWFKLLSGGSIGDTAANLEAAARSERDGWMDTYPRYAKEAEEEGFHDIAFLFRSIVEIEKAHEARYEKLLEDIKGHKVFRKSEKVLWTCSVCGYAIEGKVSPDLCPMCKHAQAFFEAKI